MIEITFKRAGLAALLILAAGVAPVQAQETEQKAEQEGSDEVKQTTQNEAGPEADDEAADNDEAGQTGDSAAVANDERQTVTGSRIRRSVSDDRRGLDSFGPVEVYSRDDLKRTGEIDTGRALRRLDPSIRLDR